MEGGNYVREIVSRNSDDYKESWTGVNRWPTEKELPSLSFSKRAMPKYASDVQKYTGTHTWPPDPNVSLQLWGKKHFYARRNESRREAHCNSIPKWVKPELLLELADPRWTYSNTFLECWCLKSSNICTVENDIKRSVFTMQGKAAAVSRRVSVPMLDMWCGKWCFNTNGCDCNYWE